MENDQLFNNFKNHWHQVMIVPPQRVGVLTPLYKWTVPYFKVAPWRVIGFVALGLSIFFYFQTGLFLVHIVSILQKGF